jgi:antitoxin (DNA-binding transcriptional repressor) of toxin-antitoxin stability system
MRAVGIKALKNKLSEYVRLAESGETVLVVDRDRVVAELTSPRAGRAKELHDAELAEAVRQGWLTPPALTSSEPPPRSPVMTWEALRRGLDEDRADR